MINWTSSKLKHPSIKRHCQENGQTRHRLEDNIHNTYIWRTVLSAEHVKNSYNFRGKKEQKKPIKWRKIEKKIVNQLYFNKIFFENLTDDSQRKACKWLIKTKKFSVSLVIKTMQMKTTDITRHMLLWLNFKRMAHFILMRLWNIQKPQILPLRM